VCCRAYSLLPDTSVVRLQSFTRMTLAAHCSILLQANGPPRVTLPSCGLILVLCQAGCDIKHFNLSHMVVYSQSRGGGLNVHYQFTTCMYLQTVVQRALLSPRGHCSLHTYAIPVLKFVRISTELNKNPIEIVCTFSNRSRSPLPTWKVAGYQVMTLTLSSCGRLDHYSMPICYPSRHISNGSNG
jgi:hypothetical protein